jgi:activator of HSP90 ATPase
MPWAKNRLPELLVGLSFSDVDDIATFKTTKIDSITGEISCNNRKGKVFFLYEIEIKVNWEATVKGSDTVHKGKIHIPNLSEENDDSDFDVKLSAENDVPETFKIKTAIQKQMIPIVRTKITTFLKELRSTHADSVLLKTKDQPKNQAARQLADSGSATPAVKQSNDTKTIKMKLQWRCTKNDLYITLLDPQRVMAFTQSAAQIAPQVGSKFALFNGSVEGTIMELVPPNKIVQKWRFATWKPEHYSTVTIEFEEESPGTTFLTLIQTAVPYDDAERTEQGWKNYFWERIKMVFGYPYETKKF